MAQGQIVNDHDLMDPTKEALQWDIGEYLKGFNISKREGGFVIVVF